VEEVNAHRVKAQACDGSREMDGMVERRINIINNNDYSLLGFVSGIEVRSTAHPYIHTCIQSSRIENKEYLTCWRNAYNILPLS
jgi:hypothetical protein